MIGASRLLRGSVLKASRPGATDAASCTAAAGSSPSWLAVRLAVCRGSGTRTAAAQARGSRLIGAYRRCSSVPCAHHGSGARGVGAGKPSRGSACGRRARGQARGADRHGMPMASRRVGAVCHTGALAGPRARAVRAMSSAHDGSPDGAGAREEGNGSGVDAAPDAGHATGARRRAPTPGIGGPMGLHGRHTPSRSLSLSSAHLQDAGVHDSSSSAANSRRIIGASRAAPA